MEEKYFYIYEWYNIDTNEVFYVGKGCRGRSNQVSKRNEAFKEYYNTHNCDVRKIEYFNDEDEALKREQELIKEYRNKNQAITNIDEGGHGGLSFVWTKKMRDYKSKYNPMKDIAQRKRMSINNPMSNPEIAEKVAEKNRRAVIINNIEYTCAKEAAKEFNVCEGTIFSWCKRGYDTNGNPCRYKDEAQKAYSETIKQLGSRAQSAKGVYIDNIYYPSVKQGAQSIGAWPETLIRAIKAKRKCKGHDCSYANQQPSQENNQNSILDGSETKR